MDCNSYPKRSGKPAVLAEPQTFLNFRLDILSSEAMKEADKVYQRACGLHVRQLRILRLVGHNPGITFSLLAAETGLERGLASRIVKDLVARGLMNRAVDELDARQFHLHLTPDGEAIRTQTAALAQRMEEMLLSPLSPMERKTLFVCLEKLTAWVRAGGGLDALPRPRQQDGGGS